MGQVSPQQQNIVLIKAVYLIANDQRALPLLNESQLNFGMKVQMPVKMGGAVLFNSEGAVINGGNAKEKRLHQYLFDWF